MTEPLVNGAETRRFERYIHHRCVELPDLRETAAEARERLREKFPRAAVRRMTHVGLLLGAALERVALQPQDALVYASTYAETRALEDFLASFPAASPLLFQTSIHPGGVQQVLIGRQQPIARLWPLAGRRRLVEQAIVTALLEPAPRVVFAGAEERGTWLLDQGKASARAFAFALVLTQDPAGAEGRLSFERGALATAEKPPRDLPSDDPCPSLEEFMEALAGRRPLAWRGAGGVCALAWS